ncbi:hypothetical protein Q664_09105 [Archangium violaceum Cb vi76]|uniref:Uncharacterized protein n=1 Tax=Archangium violaceum Cb vi76 TaxID=1406225 RepID=A0A084SYA2_9BACT|nr:hypothetical protein Q664_09105 [Archangium violaceum Cb vi76]
MEACFFKELRRLWARAFFLLVRQSLQRQFRASPGEAMTPQHLAHPGGADTHANVLLEVCGKTRARPACKGVSMFSRVALHVLEKELHCRRCQARGPARVRTGLQRLDALFAPPPAPCVHRPRGNTQRFTHLGRALAFSRQQEGCGAQCHPLPPAAADQSCQESPLPGS